jgi:hypothetical protein
MKPKFNSRIILALILALVTLTFLTGVVQTFSHARAAISSTATLSVQTTTAMDATPTSQKTPVLKSADTTGIIALAIVIVAVILVGAVWGRRKPFSKDQSNKD